MGIRSVILCVDDEKTILNLLAGQLETWFGNNYHIEKALSGAEAIHIINSYKANNTDISVILCDYLMPVMRGDEFMVKVKEIDPKIRKIMITGYSSINGIIRAINSAGLYRFISKPWDNKDLMLTVLEAIKSYEQEKLTMDLAKKYEIVCRQHEQLKGEFDKRSEAVINMISSCSDVRALGSAGHSKRVVLYCNLMSKFLKLNLSDHKLLVRAATIHDAGKLLMNCDDLAVLHAQRENSKGYIDLRKKQTEAAENLLHNLLSYDTIKDTIKYQFENFDGSGPFGISADGIPLHSRIIAIANEYDYLKNKCAEKKYTVGNIVEILESKKSSAFDPEVLQTFMQIIQPSVLIPEGNEAENA